MDKIDRQIMNALQHNGRLSNQQLAETIGLSTAACWRRVKALENTGVISGYRALLDRHKAQLNLCAFVHVTLARHVHESTTAFEQAVIQRPEVMECYSTTGDADFILRVVTEDIASLDQFLKQFLFTIPDIAQVKSNIALRELKYDTVLPIELSSVETQQI